MTTVRVANDNTGEEGSFSSESDVITTANSSAFIMMMMSKKTKECFPAVYKLPIHELKQANNAGSQIRKFILGTSFFCLLSKSLSPFVLCF